MTTTKHHVHHLDAAPSGRWTNRQVPTTPEQWVQRAREVAQILATDAAAREKAGKTPYAEIVLLKDSGLVTLLGPVEHGGAGQEWPTAYHVG